jgi:hypothetical protein
MGRVGWWSRMQVMTREKSWSHTINTPLVSYLSKQSLPPTHAQGTAAVDNLLNDLPTIHMALATLISVEDRASPILAPQSVDQESKVCLRLYRPFRFTTCVKGGDKTGKRVASGESKIDYRKENAQNIRTSSKTGCLRRKGYF